jgi:hypothetical protein
MLLKISMLFTRKKLAAVFSLGFFLVVFMCAQYPTPALAQTFNQQINYQGKLTTPASVAVADGSYSMVFRLYTVATGGSNIWSETQSVTVTDGLFSVMLGTSTSLTGVDFSQPLYLGVNIDADGEMTPRKILGAVPAAFEAGNAQTLGNIATTSFLRSDQDDTASGLLSFLGGFISSGSSTISELTTSTTTVTTIIIDGESYTTFDGVGSGLINSSGALTANISENNLNISGSPTDRYVLQASSTAAGGFAWVATSTLGFSSQTLTVGSDNQIPFSNAGGTDYDYSSNFTFNGSQLSLGGTGLSLTGSTANIALGTNYLSGDGGDEGIYIQSNGDVGIKTNLALGVPLAVSAGSGTTSAVFFGSTAETKLAFSNNTFTDFSAIGITNGGLALSGSPYLSDTLTDLFINNSGDVGIGTVNPSEQLSVSGNLRVDGGGIGINMAPTGGGISIRRNSADPFIEFFESADAIGQIRGDYNNKTIAITSPDASQNYLTVLTGGTATGSVGIGTTSPTQKLTVSGNMRLTGSLFDSLNSAGTNGMVLQTTGAGTQWVATSSLGFSSSFSNSAQLAALLSDETGTGVAVFSTSPTFTGTPIFPSTVTIGANSFTRSGAHGLTLTTTGTTNVTFPTSGTLYGTAASSITSAQLLSSISNETGTGVAVFGTAPTFTTRITTPQVLGGTAATSNLVLKTTSGVGTTDSIIFQGGNNGATQLGKLDLGSTNNVAFGSNAGATFNSLTTYNVALGFEAGRYASTTNADDNIYIGRQAGRRNVAGSNTLIGYQAGYDNTGYTNNIIGYGAGDGNTGDTNNIIGNLAGTDNAGNFNNLFGSEVGQNNTGSYNDIIGYQSGSTNTGDYNTLLGYQAAQDNTGDYNTITGAFAGGSNTGSYNNISGYLAAFNNTGDENILLGSYAGYRNKGSYNNFIGYSAGDNNTGDNNNFIGYNAGWEKNATNTIIIGANAAGSGAGGTDSILNTTILGSGAGFAIETGADNNILLGYQAADSLTTGANNIAIGYDIELASNTGSNQLNIGNLIFGTGIDGTGTTLSSGNIGIGTSSPSSKLTIAGDAYITGALRDSSNTSGTNGQILQTTGTGTQWVATSSLGFVSGDTVVTVAASDTNSSLKANADYVADGTADEVQIQAAIDAVYAAGGGTVRLLSGTFIVSTSTAAGISISMATGTALVGDSMNSTIIQLANNTNSGSDDVQVVYVGTNVQDVVISNLTIDANRSGQSAGDAEFAVAIGNGAKRILIDRINVLDGAVQNRPATVRTDELVIQNSRFADSGVGSQAGVYMYADNLRIENNFFTTNLYIEGNYDSDTALVKGNIFQGVGMYAFGGGSGLRNLVISNNFIDTEGAVGINGIELGEVDRAIVSNNTIMNARNGISLDSASQRNVIEGNVISSSTRSGIYIIGSDNLISDNSLYENGDATYAEIYVDDTSTIIGNYMKDDVVAGLGIVADFGDGTVIANNVFDGIGANGVDDTGSTNVAYDQFDRRTVKTAGTSSVGYSLLSITGTTTASLITGQQLGTGGYLSLTDDGGASIFNINNTGNVGIGTSSPTQKLTVSGNMRLTGSLFDSLNSAGTNGMVLQTTGAGTQWVATSSLGFSSSFSNSAQLAALLSDETGTGVAVFGTAPTFTTRITTPQVLGGTAATSNLVLKTTSGVGTTDSIIFQGGNNGATQLGKLDLGSTNNVAFGSNAGATFNSLTTYNVALGFEAGRYASTTNADYSSYIGYRAGYNNTGYGNILMGESAGYHNTGDANIAIGINAGQRNTGAGNQLLGYDAGTYNSGDFNTLIGTEAGFNNSGDYNIILGEYAGRSNSGFGNNFIGGWAGYNNTGNYNDMIGYFAGYEKNATSTVILGTYAAGSSAGPVDNILNSTIIGYSAGYEIQSGADNNILLGYQAADSLTTGANNIIIGYDVEAPSNTADGQLNIGNLLFGTGIDGTGTTLSSGNIGIGTTSPTQKLTVSGNLRLTGALYDSLNSAGTNGMVLQTTGAGTQWVATSTLGIGGGSSVTFGTDNQIPFMNSGGTDFEYASNFTFDGSLLSVIGSTTASGGYYINGTPAVTGSTTANNFFFAGATSTTFSADSNYNFAFGAGALNNLGSAAVNNIAIGNNALHGSATVLLSGDNNNAFGNSALRSNTTGSHNNALGELSLELNTEGSSNNAFGWYALNANTAGSNNNALGSFSLFTNTTGTHNNALGSFALAYNTTGGNNNALGNNALSANTTGTGNNAIGYNTLANNTIGSFNNALGYQAFAANTEGSNGTAIGKFALYSNTTGSENNAIGLSALYSNTTGYENTAVGSTAINSNTTGFRNTALGSTALGSNTTGTYNIAQGYQAGSYLLDGTSAASTSDYSVFLGSNTKSLTNNDQNSIVIGYNANGLGSDTVVLGNDDIVTTALKGNVGIGTTSPPTKLSIAQTTAEDGLSIFGTGAQAADFGALSIDTLGQFVVQAGGTGVGVFKGTTGAPVAGWSDSAFAIADDKELELGTDSDYSIGYNSSDDTLRIVNGNNVSSNANTFMAFTAAGNIGIGTTSPLAQLSIQKTGVSGAGVVGIDQYLGTANSVASAVQYGNRSYFNAANSATTTIVGNMYRLADNTIFGNTVRGLEVQTNQGSNTQGENTALSGFARTFGVRGVTSGDAGGSFEPAGGFFETEGTTQGNAIRGYSGNITSATLLSLFQDTSAFTGTGLEMNFGNTTGSFSSSSSKYLDFQNAGVSVFTVSAFGTTTIGDGTTNNMAGLQIGYGGICVDNDGSCVASTTGRITAVSYNTANSDLAENYFSSQSLQTGEVVTMSGGLSVARAEKGATLPILGVVSTKPGLTMGSDDVSLTAGETAYPIALTGRVPVKLSTENGPIKKGDQLMLSSLPGTAMKATGTGATIGIALEDFTDTRMYSDTYLNQFGDDMVDPVYEPVVSNSDTRINDGCYYGGGNAAGEAVCVPLVATTSAGQITEVNDRLERESVAQQIQALKRVSAQTQTVAGKSVKVGQVVMFVQTGHRWADETRLASIDALFSSSTLTELGENKNETMFDRLVAMANNFIDGVLTITGLKADKVETSELCIDDVCVTAGQLRALLEASTDEQPNDVTPVEVTSEDEDEDSEPDPPTPDPENEEVTSTTTQSVATSTPEPTDETASTTPETIDPDPEVEEPESEVLTEETNEEESLEVDEPEVSLENIETEDSVEESEPETQAEPVPETTT